MIIQHFPGGRAHTGFLALRTKLKVLIRSPKGPAPTTLSFLLTPLFLCTCTAALPVTPSYPAHPQPHPSRSGLSVSICLRVSIPLILRLCVPFHKCVSLFISCRVPCPPLSPLPCPFLSGFHTPTPLSASLSPSSLPGPPQLPNLWSIFPVPQPRPETGALPAPHVYRV